MLSPYQTMYRIGRKASIYPSRSHNVAAVGLCPSLGTGSFTLLFMWGTGRVCPDFARLQAFPGKAFICFPHASIIPEPCL